MYGWRNLQMKRIFAAIGKAFLYTALFLVVQFTVTFFTALADGIVSAVMSIVTDTPMEESAVMKNLVSIVTILSAIILTVFLVIFFRVRKKRLCREIGFHRLKPFWTAFTGTVSLGFGFGILAKFLISYLPVPQDLMDSYSEQMLLLEGSSPFWMFLATVIAAPIAEEIIFRGLVYTRLKRGMPIFVAALISAVVFGLLHGSVVHLIYTIPMGLLLCLCYEKYRSLCASVLVHMFFNIAGTLIVYYDASPLLYVLPVIGGYLSVIGLLSIRWYRKAQKNA